MSHLTRVKRHIVNPWCGYPIPGGAGPDAWQDGAGMKGEVADTEVLMASVKYCRSTRPSFDRVLLADYAAAAYGSFALEPVAAAASPPLPPPETLEIALHGVLRWHVLCWHGLCCRVLRWHGLCCRVLHGGITRFRALDPGVLAFPAIGLWEITFRRGVCRRLGLDVRLVPEQ